MREIKAILRFNIDSAEAHKALGEAVALVSPHFVGLRGDGNVAMLVFDNEKSQPTTAELDAAREAAERFTPDQARKRELSKAEALAKLEDYQQQINELRAVIEKFS